MPVATAVVASHRVRKKQATRQAIHEAAFDLVDACGLSQVTIEAISEKAGLAPRTFWSYFASKEDAVVNHDPTRPEALRAALLARPAGEDPLTALRRVLEQEMIERNRDPEPATRRHQLVQREPQLMAAVAAAYDEMARALVEAVAQRIGSPREKDMLPEVLVAAAFGACRVAQQRWADSRCQRPFPELIDEAFAQLAQALAPLVKERQT
ncbi:MAG: TetR family transcriptional regulator [Acidimicrobiales bacterium]|nr:TetR family transcriptional regulator [Acidimicrobiales bacterium]